MSTQLRQRIAVGAFIVREGEQSEEILLVQRPYASGTGPNNDYIWCRPGGKVEPGESLEDAVIREVKQETGVDIILEGVLTIEQLVKPDEGTHTIGVGYLARYRAGTAANLEPEKHSAVKWFPVDSPPENSSLPLTRAIEAYHVGRVLPLTYVAPIDVFHT